HQVKWTAPCCCCYMKMSWGSCSVKVSFHGDLHDEPKGITAPRPGAGSAGRPSTGSWAGEWAAGSAETSWAGWRFASTRWWVRVEQARDDHGLLAPAVSHHAGPSPPHAVTARPCAGVARRHWQ